MSMTTVLRNKKTGKVVSFITEQYETGLYVAAYTKGIAIPEQTGSTQSEYEYHKTLRESATKEKDFEFIRDESSPLNRAAVMENLVKFAEEYATKQGWTFTKNERGIGFNTHQLAVLRALPEWSAIENTLSWV